VAPNERVHLVHHVATLDALPQLPGAVIDPISGRRFFIGAAKKYLLSAVEPKPGRVPPSDDPPRLTPKAIERTRMSRSRERVMLNLDEMYKDAFERAKESGDESQMASLDFAYRREQLYFEILLDIREASERR